MNLPSRVKNRQYTAIDLFSGCGGLTLGLKNAGFKVVAAIEFDEKIASTYAMNHPEVHLEVKDIRGVDPATLMKRLGLKPGDLDLLGGCPPCQGFSTIGKQDAGDVRNDLVFEYIRFVEAFRPKTIMLENVPGLLKDERSMRLVRELKSFGYNFGDTPTVLNAADYGVPQRRKRAVMLAALGKRIELPLEVLKKTTVRDAIGSLPPAGQSNDPLHDLPENREGKIKNLIAKIPKNGGSRRDLPKKFQLPCHIRYPNGYRDVYGRMRWDEVSPTITSGCTNPSKGRFLHPEENRAITLREAALLQTFPKSYKFDVSLGKGLISLMIGNALPPKFIEKHALQLRKVL